MKRAAILVLLGLACRSPEHTPARAVPVSPAPAADDDHEVDLAELRRFEDDTRRRTDFSARPVKGALGPDPYRLARIGDGAVGLLRGADALVLLDRNGRQLARAAAPPSPTALAIDRSGRIWVGGSGSPAIALYRASLHPPRIERAGQLELGGAWTVRALAASPDGARIYAADQRTGLIAALEDGAAHEIGRCRAPIQLAAAGRWLVANCLAEHALVAYSLGPDGRPVGAPLRMQVDGPLWSLAAAGHDRILVAAGGVEDHPLERKDGGFGYIDSFLYLFELPADGGQPRRLAAVNLSAEGAVTPKWISLELGGDGSPSRSADRAARGTPAGGVSVRTAGYASSVLLTLRWAEVGQGAPSVESRPFLPGTTDWSPSDHGPALAASPLLDGWVTDGAAPELVPAPADGMPPRSAESRIGEALFFTSLMAPWNRSEGKLSRFTCETCHFEAYGDGRVHFTGRGTVHSATKPLRGLFNNRPHFTRALDRTMAEMVHAEFRVANRFSGHDPWFWLDAADFPWLAGVRGAPAALSPVYLRRSFMTFLMDLGFEPNQAVRGRRRFSAAERQGAQIFADRCESCHRARLVTEDPASAVPFARWEELIFTPEGPIVWASADYQKTGVEPYVHPEGARTTSLRRLHQKYPYFTNGSARSVADVLARVGWEGDRFLHDANADADRLDPDQQAALLAFLELL